MKNIVVKDYTTAMIRFISKTVASASNPSKGGVAKTPITTRTYPASMKEKLKKILEALHSARENKHALQRELEVLRKTKTKDERQAEEAILEARISTTASLEIDAELALKTQNKSSL